MNNSDILIPFCCLPPVNTDEWTNLKPFIETYNSLFDTKYTLKSFPEKDNRNTPEPEILLRDGSCKMVVERKILPLPVNYVRNHQLWHEFNDRLTENIINKFLDNLYEFRINDTEIPTKKKDAVKLAEEISNIILEYESMIKSPKGQFSGGICSEDDNGSIYWEFSIVSDLDKKEYLQEHGIISKLNISRKWYSRQEVIKELPELKKQISKLVESSVKKFANYSDCFKILLIEPYSNFLIYPIDILIDAINSLDISNTLDQVWIAKLIELNDYELIVDYRIIRNNCIK